MKRLCLAVIFLFLLAGSNILGGCGNTEDWMDEKDKQPKLSLGIIETDPVDLAGGVPSFTQKYGVRLEWWIDPISLEPDGRIVGLYPITVNRFDLTIESYNINQEFDVLVVFPSVPFDSYDVIYPGGFKGAAPIYTSSHGRGPGGFKSSPVALWAPRIGEWPGKWPYYTEDFPEADYSLSLIVTDSHGRNGYAAVGFIVQGVIIEIVEIEPPEDLPY